LFTNCFASSPGADLPALDEVNLRHGGSQGEQICTQDQTCRIHTAATSISTSNNSNAAFIGLASGVPYIHAPITMVKNNGVNFYAWTGTTNSYSGTRVQSSGSNTQICTASNFPYTGDPTSLGGETWIYEYNRYGSPWNMLHS
jgi:hypothetical protein